MPTDPAAQVNAAVEAADATALPAPDPVDVRVHGAVTITERPARSLTTDQVPVGPNPAQVVNAVPTRASLRLRAGAVDTFIGPESVTAGTGYLLPAGQTITLDARCRVYAVTAGAAGVLYVLSEQNDG